MSVFAKPEAGAVGGILLSPLATLTQLETNYALVQWACRSQQSWPMHLTAAAVVGLCIAGGILAGQSGRDLGNDPVQRTRFMAAMGMFGSALFTCVAIAQWIPIFIYGPCER